MAIRIFMVNDHPLVRQGISQIMEKETDMEVCGEAEDAPVAMRRIGEQKPDVVPFPAMEDHEEEIDLVSRDAVEEAVDLVSRDAAEQHAIGQPDQLLVPLELTPRPCEPRNRTRRVCPRRRRRRSGARAQRQADPSGRRRS